MQNELTQAYEAQVAAEGSAERLSAMKAFATQGVPTVRDENWRYSDIKSLRKRAFATAQQVELETLPEASVEGAQRIVFVNGHYSEALSDTIEHVTVGPALDAEKTAENHDGIYHLNAALSQSGVAFAVPSDTVVDRLIEIIHVAAEAEGAASHVRHKVTLGENASAIILERFSGDDSSYWLNSVVEASVAEGAKLSHVRMQEDGLAAVHTAKAYVSVASGGLYSAANISLGGQVARFEAHVRLDESTAEAYVDGVALAGTGQSHDMLVHVDHRVPETNSDQVFRTVADARGKTSFQGKVTVAVDAQHVAADQSFKALLLDRTGEANAKPELEIFADDVKCSHGATVGELDEKAMFYLTSRGIDPATARQMLVEAFTDEALARIENDDLQDAVRAKINGWMMDHARSA